MVERYQFYRRYHGRVVALALAPDPAVFWGITAIMIVAGAFVFAAP